jgi:hypothetical protein
MDARGLVSEAILDAFAVLLPVECAGCGAADRGICAVCRGALTLPNRAGRHVLSAPGAKGEGDGLPLWFAVAYDGVPKQILHALKEAGRLDGARPLGRLLGVAVADAVEAVEPRLPPGRGSKRSSCRRHGRRSGSAATTPSSLSFAGPVHSLAELPGCVIVERRATRRHSAPTSGGPIFPVRSRPSRVDSRGGICCSSTTW